MVKIPETHIGILQANSIAHFATADKDGIPQVTPVWFDYDGEFILINSAKGRKKDRNMRARPHVALSIPDPDDPYRYVGMQGLVEEITEDGAVAHINRLSHRYDGKDFSIPDGQIRVVYKIRPTRAWTED